VEFFGHWFSKLGRYFYYLTLPSSKKAKPNPQLKPTAMKMRSFDVVIGFSFSELVCCLKLISNTKLIYERSLTAVKEKSSLINWKTSKISGWF
jgi:hypothetical protein